MSKNQFLNKAAYPIFLIGIFLCSFVYIPLIRSLLKFDTGFSVPFSSTLVFLIGGYMAGVGAMIFISRSYAEKSQLKSEKETSETHDKRSLKTPHWLGLSLYIPLPFLNFILLYHFWRKSRSNSQTSNSLEQEYRKALNFQITIYLFLLLSFFLVPIIIGILMIALSLALHLLSTLYVALTTSADSPKNYPINIKVIKAI